MHLLDQGLNIPYAVPIAPPGFVLAALLFLKDAEFHRPIGQRQTQALKVRMPGKNQSFDFRDFPVASVDS